MSRIEKIEEFFEDGFEGFKVTTNREVVTLAISDDQSCCERWGYLMSEDDFTKFIGATLWGLSPTDHAMKPVEVSGFDYEGNAVFVNLNTSQGPLQFTAYNIHNGYYGHTVKIESENLKWTTRV